MDDATLSSGGLISYLAKRTRVVVITVFTHAGSGKHSLSALAYAKKCSYKGSDLDRFFEIRRREDKKQFEKYGAEVKHLGFLDALWREKEKLGILSKFLSLFLNEFKYIYPTHRLHVAKGVIHQKDKKNLQKIEFRLREIVKTDGAVVFCPVGIGKHVDHIVTREVCSRIFTDIIYWSDYNYNLYSGPDKEFLDKHDLKEYKFGKYQKERKEMILLYETQTGKLFGGKDFKLPVEKYYSRKTK